MGSLSRPLAEIKDQAERKLDEAQHAYGGERPLLSLAGLMGAYTGVVLGLGALAARRHRLPARVGAADLVLYGVATFRLSRILAKDPITSPIRAPFTRLEGTTGPAELHEEVQGT